MKKSIIILTLSMTLTACGGGGSEETKAPATISAPAPSSTEATKSTGINALKIDEQFNLSTKYSLNLDVELGFGDVRAYLNVCQKKASAQRADYNNCIYRGPIANSALETQLILSRQDIDLVAEVWFYDSSTEPLSYTWQYEPNKEQQLFTMK